jgi:hypothetical protein
LRGGGGERRCERGRVDGFRCRGAAGVTAVLAMQQGVEVEGAVGSALSSSSEASGHSGRNGGANGGPASMWSEAVSDSGRWRRELDRSSSRVRPRARRRRALPLAFRRARRAAGVRRPRSRRPATRRRVRLAVGLDAFVVGREGLVRGGVRSLRARRWPRRGRGAGGPRRTRSPGTRGASGSGRVLDGSAGGSSGEGSMGGKGSVSVFSSRTKRARLSARAARRGPAPGLRRPSLRRRGFRGR